MMQPLDIRTLNNNTFKNNLLGVLVAFLLIGNTYAV